MLEFKGQQERREMLAHKDKLVFRVKEAILVFRVREVIQVFRALQEKRENRVSVVLRVYRD